MAAPPEQPPTPATPKALLGRASALLAASRAAVGGLDEAQQQVVAAFRDLREEMVRRDLADIPVERLKDATGGAIRVTPLRKAGFTTVAHVFDADHHSLEWINGVGPTTANQAVAAARQIAEAVRSGPQFRVDLDPGNARSTRLVTALYRWDQLGRFTGRLDQPVESAAADLERAIAAAAPAASRLRMFLRGRRRRAEALAALDRVRSLLEWAAGSGFGATVAQATALAAGTVEPAVAWKDFERRSVEYYGRLGEVVDLGLDVAAAEGFLPTEIVDRVNQQSLDDTARRVSLRGYQAFGARFALAQRRVIIGDEMGLGKTIQAIAAMTHLRALDHRHFLVACPASVLVNWIREITARSTLRPHRIHGPDRGPALHDWVRDGGVGVTTLDSLHHVDVPDEIRLGMLVVDEAHYVKNPDTRRARNVRAWTDRTERVLFLTGTPMENRVEEFKNLVDFLQPALNPSIDGRHGAAGPDVFRKAVAPVYLRRNQEDVLTELPELSKVDEWVEFGRHDYAAYRDAVFAGNFMAMRRAAYAPADPSKSAKLARLVEIVDECAANGRKVVIFSFFRDVLDLVAATLRRDTLGPLTGSTAPAQRQALVDRFSSVDGHAVLLSQIQAGGVGLNMQAASVAIICEPQIKPTLEEQAIARLHRMGQVRAVQAHRLLASDSADERLLDLLARKIRLFDDYARRSDVADASPDAVDISDIDLARRIVETEQERMATDAGAHLDTETQPR
jgi:superfamily II DNA or RNA helicase